MRCSIAFALTLLAAPARAADYRVTFVPDAGELRVEACAATAGASIAFVADHARAGEFLRATPERSSGAALERDGARISASDWMAGECLRYAVDARALASMQREPFGARIGRDLVLSPHAWLWRASDGVASVRFELPEGWSVSTPWGPLDATGRRFAPADTPAAWPALVAIGQFRARTLPGGAGAMRFALLGEVPAARAIVLERYAAQTIADVASVFPAAFATQPQLVFVPVGRRSEAVPFGQSYRGGGTGIVLYVDPTRSLREYHDAWTLTHELVHVAHPYLGDDGRWIGEGFATYYQNVIRARRGRIAAREAWAELAEGFARGRGQGAQLTLRETSQRMDAMRLYMRGYWSGTAIALLGDVALRTRAQDPTSLDAAMDRFARCCLAQGKRWRAGAFLRRLDAEVGGGVLGSLYDSHVDARAFPDVAPTWRALGIDASGKTLRFDAVPEHVALRTAIMGGDP